jgi:SAM-dependent methyltransferase
MEYQCPVCESTSRDFNMHYRQCIECGLLFAPDGKNSPDLFTEAYSGHISESNMAGFSDRMVRAKALHGLTAPKTALSTSAHQEALEFIKTRLAPGSCVLDVGCSTGIFMINLRNAGYKALGCDIAKAPVDFLKAQGFDVYLGSVDEYPQEWPEPAAVTSFFVLHHIENPVEFLRQIHSRFPRSLIIISEYYDIGVNFELPQMKPPRTITIWTPESLQKLFAKAGYPNLMVKKTRSLSSEINMPLAGRAYARWRRFIPTWAVSLYFAARRALFSPYALWLRLRTRSFSLLAIAEPE